MGFAIEKPTMDECTPFSHNGNAVLSFRAKRGNPLGRHRFVPTGTHRTETPLFTRCPFREILTASPMAMPQNDRKENTLATQQKDRRENPLAMP